MALALELIAYSKRYMCGMDVTAVVPVLHRKHILILSFCYFKGVLGAFVFYTVDISV